MKKRLVIIGGGSSGLITLKYARDMLPEWEVVCYEKSDRITGCWGNPYPGFVSTSTRYTTQFACFPQFDAIAKPDGGTSREEFFRGSGFGDYLEAFADAFQLRPHIRLRTSVNRVRRLTGGWELELNSGIERADQVIFCTGLAAERITLDLPIPELQPDAIDDCSDKTVVVFGGGESAVDFANRLAAPELSNRVYLSLRSGIRVSPRYHPIRGVPSDFLRNRLLQSIHPELRNRVGERFVAWRMKHQGLFERLFPGAPSSNDADEVLQRRKCWAQRLTKAAKDDLFNMFHNKSDDFLDAVADERIRIIGPPIDNSGQRYHAFDNDAEFAIEPDLVMPGIGYRSLLPELSDGALKVEDFYLGCVHAEFADAYLVGFARPVIGNIPSISEMQAQYVCGLIAGQHERPARIAQAHAKDRADLATRFASTDLERVYPVEMFPYCDRLARLMGRWPQRGILRRWRMFLTPASTLHYHDTYNPKQDRIYLPWTLIAALLMMLPVGWVYGRLQRRAV